MIFMHMLQQSSDSLIAAAILAPFLTARQRIAIVAGLGLCDGLASLYGPLLASDSVSVARVELFAELPIFLATMAAVTGLVTRGRFGWATVAVVPVALCFDNAFSGAHPTTAVCSALFGAASVVMGVTGVAIGLGVKRGWKVGRA